MEVLSLTEFLNLNIEDKSNLDSIFSFTDSYLNELQASSFPENKVSILQTIIDKYVECGKHITYKSEDLEEVKLLTTELVQRVLKGYPQLSFRAIIPFVSITREVDSRNNNHFNKLYGKFISSYKSIVENRRYMEFQDYFDPNNTNKDRIKILILKCIELIRSDTLLSKKAQDKLIKEFNSILRQLDSSISNWTLVLGKLRRTIIVLGAMGGIATGAVNVMNEFERDNNPVSNMNDALRLLNQAEHEIQNSYSLSAEDYNETFTFSGRVSLNPAPHMFLLSEPSGNNSNKGEDSFIDFTEVEATKEEE